MDSDLERHLVSELDDVAGSVVVPPLPDVSATSSRPRQPRASRLGRVGVLAPVLVAAAVIAVVVLTTLSSSQRRETPPVATPDPTPSPSAAAPRFISYEGDGSDRVEVRTAADADKLVGAPDSFKEFIGRTAAEVTSGATCSPGIVGVSVRSLRTDGYAEGAVNDCSGGHVALWAVVDGAWREIDATQDLWDCGVLATYAVPSQVAGDTCFDAATRGQRAYRQP